jgi:hypothetical protein
MTCYEQLPFHLLDYFSAQGVGPENDERHPRDANGKTEPTLPPDHAPGDVMTGRQTFRRLI